MFFCIRVFSDFWYLVKYEFNIHLAASVLPSIATFSEVFFSRANESLSPKAADINNAWLLFALRCWGNSPVATPMGTET